MAFGRATGTAANLAAFITALDSFLTGLGWTVAESGTTSLARAYKIYNSVGESGTESIYAGVSSYYSSVSLCGMHFQGFSGLGPGGSCLTGFERSPGASVYSPLKASCSFCLVPYVALRDDTLTYWLIGDKDCFAGMVKISPYYLGFYVGLPNRFATRLHDPYPMIVDGSGIGPTPGAGCWTTNHVNIGKATGKVVCRCGQLMWTGAEWIPYRTCANGDITVRDHITWPSGLLSATCLTNDQRVLVPILISNMAGDRGTYKWVYKTSGTGLAGEDTITIGGNQYICFPDPSAPADANSWLVFRNYT